jgi:hypothetical protein
VILRASGDPAGPSLHQQHISGRRTVLFTSADPHGATVPADYTFQPSDAGTHTFAVGVTLYTAGTWATDTVSGVTGSTTVDQIPRSA